MWGEQRGSRITVGASNFPSRDSPAVGGNRSPMPRDALYAPISTARARRDLTAPRGGRYSHHLQPPSPLVQDRPLGRPSTYKARTFRNTTDIDISGEQGTPGGVPWELPKMVARQPGRWGRQVVSGAQGVSRVLGGGRAPRRFSLSFCCLACKVQHRASSNGL